ncbi:MAG TPA: tetratricopeptide repeat protein, partial [Anaerolineae bacterium]|nr:tetratricopeptide repeat protein [Anaerolineae bacterium]
MSKTQEIVHLRVLGPFQVTVGDPPRLVVLKAQRARWLLAYLAVNADHLQPRARVAGTLWPDVPEQRARRALSQALWQARRAAGQDAIQTVGDTLVLGNHVWTDVAQFRLGIVATDVKSLQEAIILYEGDFLEDCDQEWALLAREQLQKQYLDGLQRLVKALRERGEYEQALIYAQEVARQEPLREAAHEEIMRLYLSLDQPALALQQYGVLRALLLEELGVEPPPVLQALREAIETGEVWVEVRPAPLFTTPERLPFVGRREERAALLQAVDRALAGQGAIVLVEGAPGMGKSRLLAEVEQGAGWRGMTTAYAHARPLGGPYTPLQEALAGVLSPVNVAALSRLVPQPVRETAARILPELGTPLPEMQPGQLEQALVEVMRGLARCTPLVLLLDDLHDGDPAVVRVLARLASEVNRMTLLVVVAYRSLAARTQPELWDSLLALDRECALLRVSLPPFTIEEQRELVRQALGAGKVSPVVERLARAAGDAPLYTLEMLRFLHRQGMLRRTEEGEWELTVEELPLSPEVPALVQRRVRRLPFETYQIVEALAVLGDEVSSELAVAWLGPGRARLLEDLVRHGFLLRQDGGYRFTHTLVRQAVYAGIAAERRQAMHARVATLLRQHKPVAWAEVAWHLQQAGQGRLAIGAYLSAAREALDAQAHEQVVTYCDAALGLADPDAVDPTVCDLLLIRQKACRLLGWVSEARADLARGLRLARCLRDTHRLAQGYLNAGKLTYRQGRLAQARSFLARSQALWEAQKNVAKTAEALCFLADVDYTSGALGRAHERLLAADALYQQVQSEQGRALVTCRLGMLEEQRGNLVGAEDAYRQAVALARRSGDLYAEGVALNGLGLLALERRDTAQAFRTFEEVVTVAERLGDAHNRSVTLHNLAVAVDMAGRLADALRRGEMALQAAQASGNQRSCVLTLLLLGNVYTTCGQFARAEEMLTQGFELAQEVGFIAGIGYAQRDLGILARERGDLKEAVRLGRASVEHFVTLEMSGKLGQVAYHLAHSLLLAGDPAQAIPLLEQGLEHVVAPVPRALLQAILAQALAELGRVDSARSLVAAVRSVLERMAEDEHLPVAWYALAQTAQAYDQNLAHYALAQAYRALQAQALHVPEKWRAGFLQQVFSHRLIARAWLAMGPRPTRSLQTTLPQREGKGTCQVVWTLDAGDEDALVEAQKGLVALRHHRLARLLREAEAQGAHPRHTDLAQ